MQPEMLQPAGLAKPIGQYSNVSRVRAATFAFIAGQVALDEAGRLVGDGDFASQTRQVFRNIGLALEALGTDFRSIVKFTTYLVGAENIDQFFSVRRELFATLYPDGAYPPNTLLVVDRLVRPEFMIEVEAIVSL